MWTDNETAVDLLGFRVHAELVHSVVTDPKLLPVTMGVFADWGGGKTSLMKMLEQLLAPESWAEGSAERTRCEKTACLYFNGWLFEGYDDAKSAILSSVLIALGEHSRFGPKIREKCVGLLKSVNWMRVASLGFKHVALPAITAYATGGASLVPALAGSLSSLLPGAKAEMTDAPSTSGQTSQADEKKNAINWESLIRADQAPAGPLDVRSFRQQFKAMLKDCNVETLVVLIDDLDRCSPERIIENLEAIKLFLNVEHTAFVIGADPRIVRHAIALKYHKHELLTEEADAETPNTVVTDYLEKLIQYPYRLPRLSPAEIESYMALLFCQSHLDEGQCAKVVAACDQQRASNRYAVFGYAAVIDALQQNGNSTPPTDLIQALTFCAHSAPLITEGLKGNPRQVKRFLNAFVLRKKLAQVARLTNIRDDVLVKLMILEYAHEKRFRQLFDWQGSQKGSPTQIREMERAVSDRNGAGGNTKESSYVFPDDWGSPQLERWIAMEPSLSDVDLSDYFWVARDRLQSSMAGLSMVPPLVRRLFEDLVGTMTPQRMAAVKSVAELKGGDSELVLDLLERFVLQKPNDKSGYDAFRNLVEAAVPDSAKRMVTVIGKVPVSEVPPAVGTDLDVLKRSNTTLKPLLDAVLDKWEATEESRVGRALKQARKTSSKK